MNEALTVTAKRSRQSRTSYGAPSGTSEPPVGAWALRRSFSDTTDTYDRARELCAGCPVRQECLETALSDQSLQGMWASTIPKERVAIRRGRVA